MLEEYLQPKIRQKNNNNKQNGTLGENSVGREEGIHPYRYILNKLSAEKVSRVTSLP